jgi:uncharacterized protein
VTTVAPGRVDVHLHLTRHWPDLPRNSYGPEVRFDLPGLLHDLDAAQIASGLVLSTYHVPTVDEALEESKAQVTGGGGRLWAVGTVDPTQSAEAVQGVLARWTDAPGLVGLKLYPGYLPFYPHDPRLDPVYEFAARRGLPVMFHQGDTMDPNARLKFARPIEVDEVAVRYREVPFVLCHLGNPWVEEAAELIYKNENVYGDTSGLLGSPRLPYFARMVVEARERLEGVRSYIGHADRLLCGSDWPLLSIATSASLIEGLRVPEEDKTAILGRNARRLFRLPDRPPLA